MEKKKKKRDVGKRTFKDKPTEYFKPSTGETLTREEFVEGLDPTTYAYGSKTNLTKKEYEKIKRTPKLQRQTLAAPENIVNIPAGEKTPEQLKILGEQALKSGLNAPLTPQQELGMKEKFQTIEEPIEEEKRGLLGTLIKGPQLPEGEKLMTGIAPIGIAGAGAGAWKVGGKVMASPKKVVQAGNFLKNLKITKPLITKMVTFAIGGYAALKTVEGIAGYFTGRKIDEQQQALNTLGQMATTIGGQAQEGAGDWRKGLQELEHLKSEILRLESAIKFGTIENAAIKFNGKIYDINADIADQLSTIDEQITIIQSFALSGIFPELEEFEMQEVLRELEEEGFVEPIDLRTSRRS